MRGAPCPVLGVVAGARTLPTHILAAVDFGEASLLAVRAACAVAGENARIVLAYAQPVRTVLDGEGESLIHDRGVQASFAQLTRELDGRGLTVDQVVLHREGPHPAAEALLEYADEVRSDLIAAGSAQRSRLDRWLVGSVSTELVRDGRRSVLIVPPRFHERDGGT
jgi:nucleotide-binding universal stress UspA family protein